MNNKATYKIDLKRYNKSEGRIKSSPLLFENLNTNEISDENEKWFDTDEAANYLRLSPNALRIMVHKAKIRSYKIGRRLRFKKSDLLSTLLPQEF